MFYGDVFKISKTGLYKTNWKLKMAISKSGLQLLLFVILHDKKWKNDWYIKDIS